MTTDEHESTVDDKALFTALAHRRRRLVLCCLREHRRLSLPDVAEFVAENEAGEPLCELSGETVRDVYLALYHNHVPSLEGVGLVAYDQETDTVFLDDDVGDVVRRLRGELAKIVEESHGD
jgi:DNA-binding transcriptional ArsR family regulator